MAKIIRLESENIKRLKAIEIKPDGSPLVVIGGLNGHGKSSALDSIEYVLGGKKSIPGEPIRRGEDKAHTILELDDPPLVVARRYTQKGSTLTLKNKSDGAQYPSPQTALEELLGGRLAFDPIEFKRYSPSAQAETLKNICGLDFTEMDEQRATAYAERTDVNREVARLEAKLGDAPDPSLDEAFDGVPTVDEARKQFQQVTEAVEARHLRQERFSDSHDACVNNKARCERLSGELTEAQAASTTACQALKKERKARCERLEAELEEERAAAVTDLQALESERETLCARLTDGLKEERATLSIELKALEKERKALEEQPDVSMSPGAAENMLGLALEKVDADRQIAERARLIAEKDTAEKATAQLSYKIGQIDGEKRKAIEDAKMPIAGLGLSDGVVTMNGIPFEQCSTAEQIRVAVAIGIALNPKLPVLLVRDGSHLDEDSMRLMEEMAEGAGAQVWVERVGSGKGTFVVIEDGSVKE